MSDKTYTKQEMEEMANALLAEDDKKKKAAAPKADAKPEKAEPKAAKADAKAEAAEGDAKSKDKGKLDDNTIASLPAPALIMANEKLRDMLVKGKKKGTLDSSEVSDVLA